VRDHRTFCNRQAINTSPNRSRSPRLAASAPPGGGKVRYMSQVERPLLKASSSSVPSLPSWALRRRSTVVTSHCKINGVYSAARRGRYIRKIKETSFGGRVSRGFGTRVVGNQLIGFAQLQV
jgi:hypothetical protein